MSKIKPVRYAAVVVTYLFVSGFGMPPAGTVRALPSYFNTPVVRASPSGHNAVSPSSLFNHWNLGAKGIGQAAFATAINSYHRYAQKGLLAKRGLLTLIDFSKPSTQERLFVIDMEKGDVLLRSLVAHGQQSGGKYANQFSNEVNSLQSSLGLYVTLNTYQGAHGYSLRLKGCQSGINDNAFKRDIVLHGADYASPTFIKKHGYLGRSQGCPAVPENVHAQLINIIKNGSCLYIYHPAIKKAAKKIRNW